MRVVVVFFIISFFLFGCASQKERSEKFLKENPEVLAQWCNFYFPVKEKYIKGETITQTDTLYMPGIKIPCPDVEDKDGNIIKHEVECPEKEIIRDVITRIDTVQVEDSSKLYVLMSEKQRDKSKIEMLQNQIVKQKKSIRRGNIVIISLVSIIGIGISIKLFLR